MSSFYKFSANTMHRNEGTCFTCMWISTRILRMSELVLHLHGFGGRLKAVRRNPELFRPKRPKTDSIASRKGD